MRRREALHWMGRGLGLTALAGLGPERLAAVGRAAHACTAARRAADTGAAGWDDQQVRLAILDQHQDRTVTLLAEMIIPETDTPGATAANVNEFVDLLLLEWFDDEERADFLGGLADLDARCLRQFERVFVEASGSQRLALMRGLDAELTVLREADAAAPSGNAAEHERHFFHRMKMLTLYGYYTSEIGQTEELQAVIIPGRYDPCGPLRRDSSGVW